MDATPYTFFVVVDWYMNWFDTCVTELLHVSSKGVSKSLASTSDSFNLLRLPSSSSSPQPPPSFIPNPPSTKLKIPPTSNILPRPAHTLLTSNVLTQPREHIPPELQRPPQGRGPPSRGPRARAGFSGTSWIRREREAWTMRWAWVSSTKMSSARLSHPVWKERGVRFIQGKKEVEEEERETLTDSISTQLLAIRQQQALIHTLLHVLLLVSPSPSPLSLPFPSCTSPFSTCSSAAFHCALKAARSNTSDAPGTTMPRCTWTNFHETSYE